MIFLEAPAGVGYSYATTKNDLNTNDTQTALDNYAFLTKFFASYPEFAANDFYIFGESYAGIYVPTLSYTILTAPGNKVNLKGLGVGNGCFGSEVGACGPEGTQITIDYLYGHGLFSAKLYERIQQACPNPAQPSAACRVLLQEMSNQVGNVDVYNIYGPCINGPTSSELYNSDDFKTFKTHTSTSTSYNPLLNYPPENSELGGPNECIDSYLAYNYLNDPEVRKALHINITQTWVICTGAINYVSETKSLYPVSVFYYYFYFFFFFF